VAQAGNEAKANRISHHSNDRDGGRQWFENSRLAAVKKAVDPGQSLPGQSEHQSGLNPAQGTRG